MPTVDELLGPPPEGKPSVDDLLGPAPEPMMIPTGGGSFEMREITPDPSEDNATRGFLNGTSVGRVLDAFGQGAKHGWGGRPLGLSDETSQALRDAGLFPHTGDTWTLPLKAFNEGLMQPAAIALDALLRGLSAGAHGVAGAVGEVVGGAEGKRLTRDTLMLADTLGIVSGVAPSAGLRVKGRAAAAAEEAKPAAKVEAPKTAHDPVLPHEPALPEGQFVDRAGNINLDRLQTGDDVKQAMREMADQNADFIDMRRGVVTWDQTEKAADALGMDPKKLMARAEGEALNNAQLEQAARLAVKAADDVAEFSRKAAGGSEIDQLALIEALEKQKLIQGQFSGATAEAGRALNILRKTVGEQRRAEAMQKVFEEYGGRGGVDELARKLNELETPAQINKFLLNSRRGSIGDMLVEGWINWGLLSGVMTHVKNTVGNTMTALWQPAVTATAAGIGRARTLVGAAAEDRVMFGEAGAELFSIVQGAREGVPMAWKAFRTEVTSDGVSKLDKLKPRSIPSKEFQVVEPGSVNVFGKEIEYSGKLTVGGKQARIPGRLLMAEDEVFKQIATRQSIDRAAHRTASKEGLRGDDHAQRVAEIINNPSEKMILAAKEYAKKQTFQADLGAPGKAIEMLAGSTPAARLVVTFVRTPINLLKYVGEQTPLGLFAKEARDDIVGLNGAAAQDMRIARMGLGSTVAVATASLAMEGLITGGGPKDPRQRAVLYADGWAPYSVRVGNMYYSYNWVDPFSTIMGVSADAAEIFGKATSEEQEKLAGMIMASMTKNIVNKSWMSGPSDLIKALTDPDRYGDKYVQKLVGSMAVPSVVAQFSRGNDPYLRDAQTLIESIQARTPWSTDLRAKRDIWGEPIEREGSFGPEGISPIFERSIKEDPVNQELIRLKIWPAPVEKSIKGVKLEPKQYDDFQRIAGRLSKMTLDTIVATPGWASVPEFARRETIKNAIERSRESATALMLAQNPDLIQKAVDARVKQISK
jgi:hypothetical protein